MNSNILSYIEEWHKIDGVKPINDPTFIANFTKFLKNNPKEYFEFKGDNNYCDHTVVVHTYEPSFTYFRSQPDMDTFEIAYDCNFIKVFTANHNGNYVPEYISLHGEAAQELLTILKDKLLQWGGFK